MESNVRCRYCRTVRIPFGADRCPGCHQPINVYVDEPKRTYLRVEGQIDESQRAQISHLVVGLLIRRAEFWWAVLGGIALVAVAGFAWVNSNLGKVRENVETQISRVGNEMNAEIQQRFEAPKIQQMIESVAAGQASNVISKIIEPEVQNFKIALDRKLEDALRPSRANCVKTNVVSLPDKRISVTLTFQLIEEKGPTSIYGRAELHGPGKLYVEPIGFHGVYQTDDLRVANFFLDWAFKGENISVEFIVTEPTTLLITSRNLERPIELEVAVPK